MPEKKNIAIVITRLELGGAQKIALYLAENLDKKKYNIHLISGSGGYFDDYARQLIKKGVKVNLWSEIKHPINLFFDVIALLKLVNYFIKNKIDIVHTHSSKAGILGRKAAFLAGVKKIIHTIHGFPFHKYQNFIINYFYVFVEKIFANITHKLIAVGYDVMQYGLSKGIGDKNKYIVIKPGVDINLFKTQKINKDKYLKKYGLNPELFTVGMIGNLKKQKNPIGFIEIAKCTIDKQNDIQFIFAGGGKDMHKIKEILNKYKLNDRVKFIGWINEPEKFLKSIDLFLLTSLWEGLPCTLVQAICADNYCVASDIDGNREFMKEVGLEEYIYEPKNYKKAADLIIKVKNKGQRRPKINKLSEYDLKYVLKQYYGIYQ